MSQRYEGGNLRLRRISPPVHDAPQQGVGRRRLVPPGSLKLRRSPPSSRRQPWDPQLMVGMMTCGTPDDIRAERGIFSTTPSQVTESMILVRSRRASCLSSLSGGDACSAGSARATGLARRVVTHALTGRAVGSQGVVFVFYSRMFGICRGLGSVREAKARLYIGNHCAREASERSGGFWGWRRYPSAPRTATARPLPFSPLCFWDMGSTLSY